MEQQKINTTKETIMDYQKYIPVKIQTGYIVDGLLFYTLFTIDESLFISIGNGHGADAIYKLE